MSYPNITLELSLPVWAWPGCKFTKSSLVVEWKSFAADFRTASKHLSSISIYYINLKPPGSAHFPDLLRDEDDDDDDEFLNLISRSCHISSRKSFQLLGFDVCVFCLSLNVSALLIDVIC